MAAMSGCRGGLAVAWDYWSAVFGDRDEAAVAREAAEAGITVAAYVAESVAVMAKEAREGDGWDSGAAETEIMRAMDAMPWEHDENPDWDRSGTVVEAWYRNGVTVYRSTDGDWGWGTAQDSGGPCATRGEAEKATRGGGRR